MRVLEFFLYTTQWTDVTMTERTAQNMKRAYGRFAPIYDIMFGPVLEQGRRKAVKGIGLEPGHRVLEVGVGTGLSLGAYPPDVRVTGIDLAPAMLERARARAARKGWRHVEALHAMDATAMELADNSFDAVIAMYVVSVVDDPLRVVSEMSRVCREGGHLVIVNHFKTNAPLIRAAETVLKPIHRAVRFRSDLDLETFASETGLKIERADQANICGYSTVLYCRNGGENGST